jgi:hypothetical protein
MNSRSLRMPNLNKASIKILALDPGGTTGWCKHVLRSAGVALGTSGAQEGERAWAGGELTGDDHHKTLWKLLTSELPDVVVYEAFNYQIRKSQGTQMPGVHLISREYIGVAQLWCQLTGKEIVKQQPSVIGLTWVKDPSLKALGLYNSGEKHRNDATRHMLYYLVHTLGRTSYLSALRH